MTDLPLAGLRVLDLSRILAGPYCCQVLADLGADVIKVERPGEGDDTRTWGPPFVPGGGPSAYYLSCNRGKRSLALDMAAPAGREVLAQLIAKCDVLVENFLPDSLEKMGLKPEQLARLNPDLVSVSISGYGRTGPMAATPGYDLVVQAMSGLMAITGEPDGRPMKVGVAIADVLTGVFAATSALAGLYARGKGRGSLAFDLSLVDCTLASLVNVAQGTLVTGKRPARLGNAHPQIVPYESFATHDGHLVLAIGNDRQFDRFCRAVGMPDLAIDPRFTTNPLRVQHRKELVPQIAMLFRSRTTAEWLELLTEHDIPHGPVLGVEQAIVHPQVVARGMVVEAAPNPGGTAPEGDAYRLIGSPIHWRDEPPRAAIAPPGLGQHTIEILRDVLGFDVEKIDALRQAKVIAGG